MDDICVTEASISFCCKNKLDNSMNDLDAAWLLLDFAISCLTSGRSVLIFGMKIFSCFMGLRDCVGVVLVSISFELSLLAAILVLLVPEVVMVSLAAF